MSGLDFQIYYYNNSSATKKDLCHLECAHILLSTQVRVPHTKGEDGSVNENTIHLETCHAYRNGDEDFGSHSIFRIKLKRESAYPRFIPDLSAGMSRIFFS